MDAYLKKIAEQARELQDQMAAFPPPSKPVYEFFARVTYSFLHPDEKCAEIQVTLAPIRDNEFADLGDYWVHTSKILQSDVHPGQKAKALFCFDRTVLLHYLRNGALQGPQEQQKVFKTVQQMLYDITQKAPKEPCIMFVPPKAGMKLHPGVIQINHVTLENKLFLDYNEIKKMYVYSGTREFSKGVPYATVLNGLTFVPYEP